MSKNEESGPALAWPTTQQTNGPKVILVARAFPPSFDSSSRRPWKLAKYLPEAGIEVEVVTRTAPEDPTAFGIPAGVRIFGTDARNCSSGTQDVVTGSGRSFLGRLSPLDRDFPWSMRAMRLASHRARSQRTVIWVTSGPPSLLIAALAWSWIRPFRFIADFRDVWCDAPALQQKKLRPTLEILKHLERMVLQRAELVTTVSGTWVPLFSAKGARWCEEVSNGYDPRDRPARADRTIARPSASEKVEEGSNRGLIAYAGRLRSGHRDTAAISRVCEVLPATYELHYFGRDEALFRDVSRAMGDRARYRGLVPLEQLLAELALADGLLAAGGEGDTWESRGAVPAKVYEYMLTDRPILYLGDSSHEAALRVQSYPRGFVASTEASEADFEKAVGEFLRASSDHRDLDSQQRSALDARWGYPGIARRLADLIRRVPGVVE